MICLAWPNQETHAAFKILTDEYVRWGGVGLLTRNWTYQPFEPDAIGEWNDYQYDFVRFVEKFRQKAVNQYGTKDDERLTSQAINWHVVAWAFIGWICFDVEGDAP